MGCDKNMKILCVIDSLGSGGAQRQMVNLACGLKAKGHDVELFIYHPQLDFYRSIVNEAGITVNEVHDVSGFSFRVFQGIAGLVQKRKFDALISFLPSPNIYSVLASFLVSSRLKIVVSERSKFFYTKNSIFLALRVFLYKRADFVCVNSYDQKGSFLRFGFIREKIKVIYNGYSFEKFMPYPDASNGEDFSLLVIGRNAQVKNGIRLVQALLLFHRRHGFIPKVAWAGRQEKDQQSLSIRSEMDQIIASSIALQASWKWLGERSDIPQLLDDSDALIHVSLHEGLPNAVCEAFIAAKPVIVSAVCDHPLLVEDGVRGFLCDPLSSVSICEAIERFVALSSEERRMMGRNARRYAEKFLTLERMVSAYETLLK
jgi:glycosyltransferase involved in cell wall biosynthesis